VPVSFGEVSRRLMKRRGVMGVFWGVHDLERRGPHRVRVHVERKLPLDQLHPQRVIDDRIAGLLTCVVRVGHPRGQTITANQLLVPSGEDRQSTITALARRDGEWFALACGHGTLPIANAQLARRLDAPASGFSHCAHDISSGETFDAQLLEGAFGPAFDWAVLRLNMPAGADVDAASAAAGRARPELRRTQLATRERVKQFSCLDREMREGAVIGFGPVRLRMPDGERYVFPQVFEIQGNGAPFCREGDSGSLVSDEDHRAVGIVLGASEPASATNRSAYVLPLRLLDDHPSSPTDRFFD
jgi:hypothetical protein